ncbi:unnamed protein product, partial [Prorocentrum cordatum]
SGFAPTAPAMAGTGHEHGDEEGGRLLEEGRCSGPERQHIEDRMGVCDWVYPLVCMRAPDELTEEEREVAWHLRRRLVNAPKPDAEALQEPFLVEATASHAMR